MIDNNLLRDIRLFLLRALLGVHASELLTLVSRVNSSQRDLDHQVEEAMQALTTSTQLISNLEESLVARAKKLGELKSEYERVSKLAELTEEQGEAVANTLRSALGSGQKRERWIAFAINLVAGVIIFVLGVFLSEWIQSFSSQLFSTVERVYLEDMYG